MISSAHISTDLPKSLKVSELVSSRYSDNQRPDSWDLRVPGIDIVISEDGQQYQLMSDGQQSPPQAGTTIILRDLVQDLAGNLAYTWTLYGI